MLLKNEKNISLTKTIKKIKVVIEEVLKQKQNLEYLEKEILITKKYIKNNEDFYFYLNNIFNFIEKKIDFINKEKKISKILDIFLYNFHEIDDLIRNLLLKKDNICNLLFKENFNTYLKIFFSVDLKYFKENNFIKIEDKIQKIKDILEEEKDFINKYNNKTFLNLSYNNQALLLEEFQKDIDIKKIKKLFFILHNLAVEYQRDKYIGYVRFNWNQELGELKTVLIKYIILIYSKIIIENNNITKFTIDKILKYLTLLDGVIFILDEDIPQIINYLIYFNNKLNLKMNFLSYKMTYLYPLNIFIVSLFTINNITNLRKELLKTCGVKMEEIINIPTECDNMLIFNYYKKKIFENNIFYITKFEFYNFIISNNFFNNLFNSKKKLTFFKKKFNDCSIKRHLLKKFKFIGQFFNKKDFITKIYKTCYKDININNFCKLKKKKDFEITIQVLKYQLSTEDLFYLFFEFE